MVATSTAATQDETEHVSSRQAPDESVDLWVSPEEPFPARMVRWYAADAAVVGSAHLRSNPPKPCQDVALADANGRPLAVLADGAGSAVLSHLGAAAVVAGIRRLCRTMEDDLALALDMRESNPRLSEKCARRMVSHAIGLLDDLSEVHARPAEDFRCTLLASIIGRQRALWVKVGDGALVVEINGKYDCIGPIGKGEFANQTCFIGHRLEDEHWDWGEIDALGLTGFAAMSDGAAERLVATDASRVSPVVGVLLREVANGRAGRRELFGLLAEAGLWKGTSGDDKSLALIGRVLLPS